MKRATLFLASFAVIALFGGFTMAQTASAAPSRGPSAIGNDISYPQCNKTLPTGQAFGIVGVNGGKATLVNPCLTTQLKWAASSNGSVASQPKIQLYVNTANPGEVIHLVTTWPTSGETPYGSCDGTNSLACSWQYGRERAEGQVVMFADAVAGTVLSPDPGDYTWWLDVETENTWQTNSSAGLARNRAALEGMNEYFQSVGATVGIYSTGYQWGIIAGAVPSTSSLFTLDSWLAGARTQRAAQSNCRNLPLVPGGRVVLTQYVSAGLDYDISCV
jgi:hypothetical protein